MTIHRLPPESLKGPRAYFTEWNKRNFPTAGASDAIRLTVLRKLKSLLLTKRNIVFAASDLNSPIAFQILVENPELLDQGILLPALREDRNTLEDVTTDPAVRSFIADRSVSAVSWKLDENVDWFKSRLIDELSTKNSVIRTQLLELDSSFEHNSLVVALSVENQSVQDVVDQHANFMSPPAREVLLDFRRLLYHMSGARVVHSESFLPQENLIDRDILSTEGRARLSEDAIFFKIFVEQALRTLGRKQIPIEFLDEVSIPEILTLRSVYDSSGFIESYDKMVESMLRAAVSDDPRTAIFHLTQLEEARNYLFSNFTRHFETELQIFNKAKRITAVKSVVSPSTSVALGVSGLILGPTGALVASLLSLAKDSLAMRGAFASMVNLFRIFSTSGSVESELASQSAKIALLKKNVGTMASDSGLLEAAEKYSALVSEAYKI